MSSCHHSHSNSTCSTTWFLQYMEEPARLQQHKIPLCLGGASLPEPQSRSWHCKLCSEHLIAGEEGSQWWRQGRVMVLPPARWCRGEFALLYPPGYTSMLVQ